MSGAFGIAAAGGGRGRPRGPLLLRVAEVGDLDLVVTIENP